jgi:iron complex outermembrane recepter protein
MPFNEKKLAVLMRLVCAGAIGAGSMLGVAQAQQPAQPAAAAPKVEKIDVTGSSIKRIEGESALPVTVITRAEIERTGATSPMELLQIISSNNSFGNVSLGNVIGSSTFSAQTASLRGLGGGRTLVLVDGKRFSGFAGEVQGVQGVNLAVIPFAAIERVEVLKDGASAVYGSDAIGGVINFILRSDYRGAEVTVWGGEPTRAGGGGQQRVQGTAGFGDLNTNRFNVVISGAYNHQKALEQKDRDFSRTSYLPDLGLIGISSNTMPGNVTTGGIGVPSNPNCAPSTLYDGICFYDPANTPGVMGIPDEKLGNFYAAAKFQINNDWTAYASMIGSKSENHYTIQPVPISNVFFYGPNADIPMTITIQPGTPFYPTAAAIAAGVNGQPLNVRWRAFEAGLRDTTDTNTASQFTGGLKGVWGNWDVDTSAHYAESETKSRTNGGFPILPLVLPLLNSGNVNLFGPNTPEITNAIRATNFNGQVLKGTSKNYGVSAKASGELMTLPTGGKVGVAFGAEFRKEKLEQTYADVIRTGDVSGFGGSFPDLSGQRDVRAIFAETVVPLTSTLELNAAIRQDRYNDFGTTANPKVSMRWQPNKTILARASYGKGFLAPSLYQLFIPQGNTVSPPGTSDPIRCPVTGNIGIDCATQFTIINGGNPNLRPEKSEQVTGGIVFEPTANLSTSLDYFKIRLNGQITNGIPFSTILGDLNTYGNLVTRGPVDPAFPNLPGRITAIQGTYLNLGAIHIEGLDLETHWKGPKGSWGSIRVDASGTYYRRYDVQNPDGSYSGFVSNGFGAVVTGITPRWRHYISTTYERGPWSVSLANSFQSEYTDVQVNGNGDLRKVSSMSLWDLQGSYKGIKNLTLTLGVKNLLDTNPPETNQQNTFQSKYDASYYDARARFVYGSAQYTFK